MAFKCSKNAVFLQRTELMTAENEERPSCLFIFEIYVVGCLMVVVMQHLVSNEYHLAKEKVNSLY
jgi:hypothetical protein